MLAPQLRAAPGLLDARRWKTRNKWLRRADSRAIVRVPSREPSSMTIASVQSRVSPGRWTVQIVHRPFDAVQCRFDRGLGIMSRYDHREVRHGMPL